MKNNLHDIEMVNVELNEERLEELMDSLESELSGCGIVCGGSPIGS